MTFSQIFVKVLRKICCQAIFMNTCHSDNTYALEASG